MVIYTCHPTYLAGTLPLEPHPQPFFALLIFQVGSPVFAHDPSIYGFLCSWDHRCVPLCPAFDWLRRGLIELFAWPGLGSMP
jgi:hypothetical protein